MTTFPCQALKPSEVCLLKSLGPWESDCKLFQTVGLLFASVLVHWIPAKLSAISSPCHRASINQYAPQAARGTWRGNNTSRSHACLNIQGLLVAADWAPHHCPRKWKKKKGGVWDHLSGEAGSQVTHRCVLIAALRWQESSVCECECECVLSTMSTRVCKCVLTIPGAQRCIASHRLHRFKFMIFKNIYYPESQLNMEIRIEGVDHRPKSYVHLPPTPKSESSDNI